MRLKSLELQGFKSFPDKTKLLFESGTTVIVGPNGSGKSNISDAMRWVLGEISNKSMRSTRMEDIIFGGSESRKPMSYAEVSLTLDNTDKEHRLESPFDEVTVTRRYYRAGESEYFINRQPVRLRDIYQLFMNTGIGRDGYSIIGQGRISEIISKKSDERRGIFEDASGIAKYRFKKNESERRLAATEENMVRIGDLFGEVSSRLGPLEKDAVRAKKALELMAEKKKVDIRLWIYDTKRVNEDLEEAESNFNVSKFDLDNIVEAIATLERRRDKLDGDSLSNRRHAAEIDDRIKERIKSNYDLDKTFNLNIQKIRNNETRKAELETDLDRLLENLKTEKSGYEERKTRLEELSRDLIEKREEQKYNENISEGFETEAAALGKAIDEAFADIESLKEESTNIKVRKSVIEKTRLSDIDKNSLINEEIANYEKISESLLEQKNEKTSSAAKYGEKIEEYGKERDSKNKSLAEGNERKKILDAKLSERVLEKNSCLQRIETFTTMEEQLEGYSPSVKYVMRTCGANKIGRVYGPLSRLITVEDRYVRAIETALGANLQHIVVEDEEVAKAAIELLKRDNAGRATFFPLTSMRASTLSADLRRAAEFKGYLGFANELIRSDPKFSDIISNVAGRIAVFDNMDDAAAMAKSLRYTVRTVTLDGQQINVGGSFTGGSARATGGILSRAGEIKKLRLKVRDVQKEIDSLAGEKEEAEAETAALENEIAGLEEKIKLNEVLRSEENAVLEKINAKYDANNELIGKLRDDLKKIGEMSELQSKDLERLEEREKEIEKTISELVGFRQEKDIERNAISDRKSVCDNRITELRFTVNGISGDIEREHAFQSQNSERIDRIAEEIAAKREKIDSLERENKELSAMQKGNKAENRRGVMELESLNEEKEAAVAKDREYEKEIRETGAKIKDRQSRKETLVRDNTVYENRLKVLTETRDKLSTFLWDEYEMTGSEAVALGYPPLQASERKEAAALQASCRNRLRNLGNVDLDAVNKYREVKERHDKMKEQIDDLNNAKTELMSVIGDLEKNMESAFLEAFNEINGNFNRVFSELFGGGSAMISLSDPSNVLESGIEISAAPPGKIIKNIIQLSGGEQAFVAIALFFAILQVNPTPFCVLDEIEAALDEVNVGRFAEYIKKYSEETQFVLISHRRGTMEAANRLYGVTMPEHGVSKVLTLDVDEMAKAKGDKWNGFFE